MKMNYLVPRTKDRPAATEFYNKLLVDQAVDPVYEGERMTLWQGEDFLFVVAGPFDGNPATIGNGCMPAPGTSGAVTMVRPANARAAFPLTCANPAVTIATFMSSLSG